MPSFAFLVFIVEFKCKLPDCVIKYLGKLKYKNPKSLAHAQRALKILGLVGRAIERAVERAKVS